MKDLLEYIARALVDEPDAVEVREVEGERGPVLELRVAPDDMGKVIGKRGRIARAIRSVIRAGATHDGKTALVEIVE